MVRQWIKRGILLGCVLVLMGCGAEQNSFQVYEPQKLEQAETAQTESTVAGECVSEKKNTMTGENISEEEGTSDGAGISEAEESENSQESISKEEMNVSTPENDPEVENTQAEEPTPPAHTGSHAGKIIVIDAGHQAKGNKELEPIGPGAETMKAKVSSGTRGVVTKLPEYELTLTVAKQLEEELLGRGYEVIMVRTTHEVDISNSERAKVANDAGAAAFIRIHANGSENPEVHGAETICQTPDNPYNGELAEKSKDLSEKVLDGIVKETGCKRRKVWETDTMSGINWCQVPVTIVEMGYMSNESEDRNLSREDYQQKIVKGIADGIDLFLQ
ncbi:MAG: N-acetylmuramoyl-L-alanine amidase [Acetatifactor sp.]